MGLKESERPYIMSVTDYRAIILFDKVKLVGMALARKWTVRWHFGHGSYGGLMGGMCQRI